MAIVVICRDAFSGSEALADRIAQRLGCTHLTREQNISAAAKQYRIPLDELTAAMDRRPSFWDKALGASVAYVPAFRACLCERAAKGALVYSGYLGHLLLPGVSHVLSVRVVADLDERVRALMGHDALPRAQALATLDREDRTVREWARFIFGVEWDSPGQYDFVVNLSRLDLETACETIVFAAGNPQFQTTAVSRQALQDLALQSRVTATLAMDFRTRDARLKVTASAGVVTIRGATRWSEIAEAIPQVVRRVEGVKEVHSDITGGTPPSGLTWY